MSYRKLKDGKYKIEVEKTVNKQRYRKAKRVGTNLKGKDLKIYLFNLEMDLLKELEEEINDEEGFRNFTFFDLSEYYLENADIEQRTKDFYKGFLTNRTYETIGGFKVKDIKKADIEQYVNHLKTLISPKTKKPLSPKTIKHYLVTMNVILNYALSLEIIDKNPAQFIKAPKKSETLVRKYYSTEELNTIIPILQDKADTYHFLAFIFTIYTGIRPGELHGLTWDRVDLDNSIVTIDRAISRTSKGSILKTTKTRDQRFFKLSPFLSHLFSQHKQLEAYKFIDQSMNDKFVFSNSKGGVVTEKHFNDFYKNFCIDNNIRYITWYGLRHTAATILAAKKVPAINIAKRLGHTSTATTEIYIHAVESVDDEVDKIMDKVTKPNVINL